MRRLALTAAVVAVLGTAGVVEAKNISGTSKAEHANDLAGLEDLAFRFGIPVGDGKVDQIFTKPDALKRAIRRRSVSREGEITRR